MGYRWTAEELAARELRLARLGKHVDTSGVAVPKATGHYPDSKASVKSFDPFLIAFCDLALPTPAGEFRFHPSRMWRFDWAWPDVKFAIEVEGGAWTQGRHTRGQGFIDDMEKYTAAVLLGWRVARFTPQQATDAANFAALILREAA